jgi:hypothetical protein
MKYQKIKPKVGDVIAVSDQMSLRFEKLAEDLEPVWMEVPLENSTHHYSEGAYFTVTQDVWFVFQNHFWRVMTMNERLEAYRQNYFNDLSAR